MTHSEKIDLITKALIEAEGDFKEIKKGDTAKAGSFTFKYADLAEIFNATKPALRKAGIKSIGYFSAADNGDTVLNIMLSHISGQWIKSSIKIPASTTKPTELGAFITYMRRYLYTTLLGITAEEDVEGDALNDTVKDSKELTEDEKETLVNAIGNLDESEKAAEFFRKTYNVWDLTKVTRPQYNTMMATIKRRAAKPKEALHGSVAMA